MLRNYLAAALRNLARNKLYASISIAGLAAGLCAAIIISLALRNQFTFDRFIPGYERIYLAVSVLSPPGQAPLYQEWTHTSLGARLKQGFAAVEATTRLAQEDAELQRGDIRAKESLYWADPNVFEVLRLPVAFGDLNAALRRPDGIVLTRSMARKYFGRDNAVGASLRVKREHPMTVTAVIEDLPVNGTQLDSGIFASGLASWSELTRLESDPKNALSGDALWINVRTYLRLAPNASIEHLRKAMPPLVDSMWPRRPPGLGASLELVRLDRVHTFKGLD
ncbi:MAG TPA: ABC transporter permease, partial [Steroidobacteraceae bacterium]|nr:ABC transporter permease [Steroidobacteraceae bacterium]